MAALTVSTAVVAGEKDARCFELRTYYATPGKLEALHARFRDHTVKIFTKHGMSNLGYWVPLDNPENKLIYLLAYPSREARQEAWKAFSVDPDWKAVYKASIADGRLVSRVVSVFLGATDYSPPIKPSGDGEPRTFELRRYTATPGKLAQLHARFRDHTLGLFSKHGMGHFGYWVPMDEKEGAKDTLIYILAHKSDDARKASFAAFREDPAWTSAKEASEKEGSLTVKVESVTMVATDYSPTR